MLFNAPQTPEDFQEQLPLAWNSGLGRGLKITSKVLRRNPWSSVSGLRQIACCFDRLLEDVGKRSVVDFRLLGV
ncbi:MAG TPA: hypothetical protein VK390_05375 [Propionibacteriaceae bacterium]|nr:hypothetical protein [Propionibacteriaceae bacterium]